MKFRAKLALVPAAPWTARRAKRYARPTMSDEGDKR
jgi:hypothetical protein